jgi:hypothetical protein
MPESQPVLLMEAGEVWPGEAVFLCATLRLTYELCGLCRCFTAKDAKAAKKTAILQCVTDARY